MPLYEYKAADHEGRIKKGSIEADSQRAARQKLKRSGIFLTDIKEKSASRQKNSSSGMSVGRGVSTSELALTTRQLSSLVKASVPLVEGLTALIEQTENERLKVVLNDVRQTVNEGGTLASGLARHPKVFNDIYVNMVEAGEASGTLALVLRRLADFSESQVKMRSEITSGMAYPLIIMLVAVAIMIGLFAFGLPKIVQILEQTSDGPLPLQTRILIWVSDMVTQYWLPIIIFVAASYWIFARWKKSPKGRARWDRFVLRAPVFGNLIRMINISRFASTLETLIASGVPILSALGIVKNLVTNTVLKNAIEASRENISEGQSIAVPLKESGEFPPVVTHMIAIGEKTGELEEMLRTIAESYEEQVKTQIQRMTSLLEPLMLVLMGGMVGYVVYSIIVPMMEINKIR